MFPAGNLENVCSSFLPSFPVASQYLLCCEYRTFRNETTQSFWRGNCYALGPGQQNRPSYLQSQQGFASKLAKGGRIVQFSCQKAGSWWCDGWCRFTYVGAFFCFERAARGWRSGARGLDEW